MPRSLTSSGLDQIQDALLGLFPHAGETLRRQFLNRNLPRYEKKGVDLTTAADLQVDAYLRQELARLLPGGEFLTEESAPADWSTLRAAEGLWVIDPLDGTINFTRGVSHFAISVAWLERGQPRLGAVYLPMTGDLYLARADQDGAFKNGHPIQVASTPDLRQATLACDWAWDLDKRLNVVRYLNACAKHVRQIKSMGSAVADLAQLAEGRIDAYVHSGLKPWDTAAASLIVTQAGGLITTPSGSPWSLWEDSLLAAGPLLHPQFLALLSEAAA